MVLDHLWSQKWHNFGQKLSNISKTASVKDSTRERAVVFYFIICEWYRNKTTQRDESQNTARRQQRRRLWFVQLLHPLLVLLPVLHLFGEPGHLVLGGAELLVRVDLELVHVGVHRGAHRLVHGEGGHVAAEADGQGAGQQHVLGVDSVVHVGRHVGDHVGHHEGVHVVVDY